MIEVRGLQKRFGQTAPHSKAEAALTGMTAIFLLISVFVGGMNLAMDIVAGERERRSLLPLLMNPVSRGSIVLGKWLAVFLFGAGSLILATGAFAITFGVANIRLPLFSPQRLFSWSVLGLLPLAGLAAALQLTLSTFCRTAKEAQTYLSLLMFVPMGITMFLLFVEPKPPVWVECLPIAGHQALLTAESAFPPFTSIVLLGTVWLTAMALQFCKGLLERDEILYGR
jgi:sodium transport system permease protein